MAALAGGDPDLGRPGGVAQPRADGARPGDLLRGEARAQAFEEAGGDVSPDRAAESRAARRNFCPHQTGRVGSIRIRGMRDFKVDLASSQNPAHEEKVRETLRAYFGSPRDFVLDFSESAKAYSFDAAAKFDEEKYTIDVKYRFKD